MHPMLTIAVRAARRAGSIINRASLNGGALNVRSKRVNDFVTQVDQAAEEAIIEIVRKAHPDHGFLAEESGTTAGAAEYVWIIDPLDGTTNFIHGFPQYCVSIAVEHRGALAHGVVYDPVKNELFTASKGRGAFLNDRRIRVSKCTRLKESLVGTGFPFKELSRLDLYTGQLRNLIQGSAGVRRAGAVGHGGRSAPDPGSGRAGGRFQRRSALHAIGRHQRGDTKGLSSIARSAALRVAVASGL